MRRPYFYLKKIFFTGIFLLLGTIFLEGQSGTVKVWEEPLTLPTYKVEEPCVLPVFYNGRAYQGAEGHVYPYPLQDNLTQEKEEKTYKAVYLENKYLKICVLPEIGGRIFSALDKTNNYHFFYRQHVIKPALVGMLGAWISGGVEWNFPHHHRATSFMPVDYTTEENPDGSCTIWVGELEYRHRMRWIVGLTLRPGKSYIEVTFKLFNRTPYAHSFLCWANNAVHTNKNYEVIFPPDTQFATYHGKNQFSHWPISREFFHKVDYTEGVDVRWWKNHPSPTSFFAWKSGGNFIAGYDHGKEAGVIHVANPHLVPGKKFWTWGTGSKGKMWEEILTDEDGPYLELMIGAFSDNQPDYSWLHPYEVRIIKQHWYPLREIKGVKKATPEAAVNLELDNSGKAFLSFNTTSFHSRARSVLKSKDQLIFEKEISVSPHKPYTQKVQIPEGVKKNELEAALFSEEGELLVHYSPSPRKKKPMPEPAKPPPPPDEISTQEELYLTGLRLEQFYNPALEPYPYYREALKRDPGDSSVNTRLGILYVKRFMFEEARKRLEKAVGRVTQNYTHPKNCEPFYYLGTVLEALGKDDRAFDVFYKAAWSSAWAASSYYHLAQIACRRSDYNKALELIEKSLSLNTLNTKGISLKAAVLRKLGRYKEASQAAQKVLSIDPLDFWAGNEVYLSQKKLGENKEAVQKLERLTQKMRDSVQSYLELALDYKSCGLWEEALDVLNRLIQSQEDSFTHPLLYYHTAHILDKKGQDSRALEYYKKASQIPSDYCFPFRQETIPVLRRAQKQNPEDSMAPYYLGNLLFDHQPREAIKEWEKSLQLDPQFFLVHRNLGLAYARVENDLSSAVEHMEKAVHLNSQNARLYFELDRLYEAAGVSPQKRLAVLEKSHEVVKKRDDALAREIRLLVHLGHYEKAIHLLETNHFHIWEGGGSIHRVYEDAYLLRGIHFFRETEYHKAIQDYRKALEYPVNLQVGKPPHGGRAPVVYYYMAQALEAIGEEEKAVKFYKKCFQNLRLGSSLSFYQGLALKKMGREEEPGKVFEELIKEGKHQLEKASSMDFFSKFGEKQDAARKRAQAHYLWGLGCLGNGEKGKAREQFQKALELNPTHTWARYFFENSSSIFKESLSSY